MILNKPYRLTKITKLTPEVSSFLFKADDGAVMDFVPGMFAMLQYKNEKTGESVARAFSIANAPPSNSLEFVIALIHGRFTSKLDTAAVGDLYYVSAPYGQFKFDINEGDKFLFLAGGTGIAPFISMLRQSAQTGNKSDAVMIYSTKFATELIYHDELMEYEKTSKFKLAITVTRPQPGDSFKGYEGHVNAEMIAKVAPDFKDRISYICGPPAFVKALKVALESLGADPKKIRAEMWGE